VWLWSPARVDCVDEEKLKILDLDWSAECSTAGLKPSKQCQIAYTKEMKIV